jgi:hypothetical protein
MRLPPRPIALLALLVASVAACGAATGLDVGDAGADVGADEASVTPTGDAAQAGCARCDLPDVCVSLSTTPTHSVSSGVVCAPLPSVCDGVLTCDCAGQLCGAQHCFNATTTSFRALLTCYAL